MKTLFVSSLIAVLFPALAFASTARQATLLEMNPQGTSAKNVSYTRLQVTSANNSEMRLETTNTTQWRATARLHDVKGVVLQSEAQGMARVRATIYEVDGNSMGTIVTNVSMTCSQQSNQLQCQGVLAQSPDRNQLLLTVDQ